MLAAHLDVPRGRLAYLGPQRELRLGDRVLPLQDGAFWLNFRGPGAFAIHSALDVVEGRLPPGALQDKAVLIGQTRLGYDSARGPFGPFSGLEVQATALDNLLAGDPLRRSSRWADLAATFGLGLLIALLFLSSRLGLFAHAGLFLVALAGWLGASYYALSARGLWLPWLGPAAAAVAALLVGQALAWMQEAGKRRFLKKAFSHYLGEDALEQLLASPERLELGGERQAAFRAGRFAEARAAFLAFQAANPGDVPAQRFLERLRNLNEAAAAGFSPVAVFHEK